jgi:hypothetical protein
VKKKFPAISPLRLTGAERFVTSASVATPTVLDFWRWSTADLMSNATRGILAEFIVAHALGVTEEIREEWAPVDLTYEHTSIEVKCAGHLQAWGQDAFTVPKFGVRKTRHYDRATGDYRGEPRRQASLYVFCLHHCRDPATVNPLDLDQWSFYVVPTRDLDDRFPSAEELTLSRLEALHVAPVAYADLRGEVDRVRRGIQG